jgi:hypothetical protein
MIFPIDLRGEIMREKKYAHKITAHFCAIKQCAKKKSRKKQTRKLNLVLKLKK